MTILSQGSIWKRSLPMRQGLRRFPNLDIYPYVTRLIVVLVFVLTNERTNQVLGITINGVQDNQLFQDEVSTTGHTGPLQLWYGGWGADYPDPQDWLSNFFAKGGQDNYANYGQNNSPAATEQQAVQAELAQADGDQNQAERLRLYQDAEQKIVNDVGWITLYQTAYVVSVNPKLQGFKLNALATSATSDWANIYFAQ